MILGSLTVISGFLTYFYLQQKEEETCVDQSVNPIVAIKGLEERKPFQQLYTILISGKRYSGKQTVAEGLRKQFSSMNHNSRVFYRANVLGGPPVAGNYKPKEEILRIYKEGMAQSSLFYANRTLDMLYDRHSPQEKLVLIISDIRNEEEINFWQEKSESFRTIYVDAPDDDRKHRGWDGHEDEYKFGRKHKWDFILENGEGNDVQNMTTQLFLNSLLPCIEGRAEISIITHSTLFSKYLQDYAYILATATQAHFGKVSSVSIHKSDVAGTAIGSLVACILQVPLSFEEPTHSDVYVTTLDNKYKGPKIQIDPSIYSYQVFL